MKNPIPTPLLAMILSTLTLSLHHDYELSRGRKMWVGHGHAIHYFDHFTLLSHRLNNAKGEITSLIPFIYKKDWTLAFNIKKMGPTTNSKDGFIMLLSPQNVDIFGDNEELKRNADFLAIAVN